MKGRCLFCKRPVKRSIMDVLLFRTPFCPPEQETSCIATVKSFFDPPSEEEEPEEDPEPEDRWVCPSCEGHGEVIIRRDWETGAYETQECLGGCLGTGRFEAVVMSGVGFSD